MGQLINLTTSDGHNLSAYRADPSGAPKGGLVVIQENFWRQQPYPRGL